MAYIAQKPCTFAERNFWVGETVPDEFILPESRASLVKMGILADTAAAPESPVNGLCVCDGERTLRITQDGLQFVFDVMTKALGAAEPRIGAENDADALLLLARLDNRKTVKEAANSRLEAVAGAGEGQ